MSVKVTQVYPKVVSFLSVVPYLQRKLRDRGLSERISMDLILRVLSSMAAPTRVFPPAPLTRARTQPNLGSALASGTAGGGYLIFNPYFFADTGEVTIKKDSIDPSFTLEQYAQALINGGGYEAANPDRQYIAVPPEIGRIIEEGYDRGYLPYFTDQSLYLFAFSPGAKPLIQTGTLPVLVAFHVGGAQHPLTGDFRYWDAVLARAPQNGYYSAPDGKLISEKMAKQYQTIQSKYAVVSLDGVTYPEGVEGWAQARAGEKAERAEQAIRAKARKAILSGGQAAEDAEAIGLTEQGYQNLLTLGYPYMVSKPIYDKDKPTAPPPIYAQAIAGALAFLARQEPTIILGRGPVSDIARNIVDTFLRTTHLVHENEADRKLKVEKMIREDREARRKLALWEQKGWDQRGLKEEDRFYPYAAADIYFDQMYSMTVTVAAVIDHLHLGHEEAQKYGQRVYDARERAMKDLRTKYDNMPEKVEQKERAETAEREKKERNERRPRVIQKIKEQMQAWIESYPTVDIGKALKSTKSYIFYLNGDWYLPAPKGTKVKQGFWLLLNANGFRCSRLVTEGRIAPSEEFVEAYGHVAAKLPGAMPLPARNKNARYEALRWEDSQRFDSGNKSSDIERMVVLAQQRLASKPDTSEDA